MVCVFLCFWQFCVYLNVICCECSAISRTKLISLRKFHLFFYGWDITRGLIRLAIFSQIFKNKKHCCICLYARFFFAYFVHVNINIVLQIWKLTPYIFSFLLIVLMYNNVFQFLVNIIVYQTLMCGYFINYCNYSNWVFNIVKHTWILLFFFFLKNFVKKIFENEHAIVKLCVYHIIINISTRICSEKIIENTGKKLKKKFKIFCKKSFLICSIFE